MPVSTPPADLAVTAFKALVAWREIDRVASPDTDMGYAALQNLRDLADRLDTYTMPRRTPVLDERIHELITRGGAA